MLKITTKPRARPYNGMWVIRAEVDGGPHKVAGYGLTIESAYKDMQWACTVNWISPP